MLIEIAREEGNCHRLQSCQVVIINQSDILNVGMSKPPKVASRPAGVWGLGGGGRCKSPPPRSKQIVSKMKTI